MVPSELTPVKKEALDLDPDIEGVFVDDVQANTPADEGGLKAGDVIIRLNGKDVDSIGDFYSALNSSKNGEHTFRIYRNGKEFTLGFSK